MRHRIMRLHAGQQIVIGQPAIKKIAFMLVAAVLFVVSVAAVRQGIVGGGVDSAGAPDTVGERVMLIVMGGLGVLLFGPGSVLYGIRLVRQRGRLVLTRGGLEEQHWKNGRWQVYRASPWREIRTIRLEGVLERRLSTITLYGVFGRWEISARYSWWKRGLLRLLRRCQHECGSDGPGLAGPH